MRNWLPGLWLAFMPIVVCGYNEPTHEVLSEEAVSRSALVVPSAGGVLQDLGLKPSVNVDGDRFPDSNGDLQTISRLIQLGTRFEDRVPRSIHHFFDPTANAALLPALAKPSPDWALEDKGAIEPPASLFTQRYSFRDGRGYFLKGLTEGTKTERDRNFGLMFETVGHVVHHLQDMAQPQHVRLDPHLKLRDADKAEWIIENRSRYEQYTQDIFPSEGLPFTSPEYQGDPAVKLGNARHYWADGAGGGISEFTNANFLSAGTNFKLNGGQITVCARYPSPMPNGQIEHRRVEELFTNADELARIQKECADLGRECVMTFYATTVTDAKFGATQRNNPRASTLSIFSQDLTTFRKTVSCEHPDNALADRADLVFALNRFNFKEAHKFLIPRAVAYSAGLINYLFRGKIDFVPDPGNAGQYLIKNLGTEPMKGEFRLYYDDAAGNRAAVKDANDNPLIWDTKVLLAGAQPEGTLPAGGTLPVPAFAPPTDPAPKVPGEYMLVFTGDMGEEKADPANGVVGAVIGKQIRNEYKGALYIVGLDESGMITSLRVDRDGTRVIRGWDISKRDANNPNGVFVPPSNDVFDPLGLVYGASTNKPVRDKIYAFKQAEYGPGPIEYEVKGVTFTEADNPNATRTFYGQGLKQVSSNQVVWVARSPDVQIGTFEFRLTDISFNGRDAFVAYTRRFTDATGTARTATGFLPLPTLPSPFSYQQFYGQLAPGNSSFPLVVSDDGLTIRGFATAGANNRIHTWIAVALGAIPQFALQQSTYTAVQSGVGFVPPPYQTVGTCSIEVRPPNSAPMTVTAPLDVRRGSNNFESSLKEEVPITNLGGRIVTYVRESLVKRTHTVDESLCFAVGVELNPATGLAAAKFSLINTANNSLVHGGGTFERFNGGDYAIPTLNVPVISITPTPVKEYPGGLFLCESCQWSQIYQGFDPVPVVDLTRISFQRGLATRVVRPLTDRHADVIYEESASQTQPFTRKFRGIDLSGREYVAESSPLGEVFFAFSDKSTLIHEPLPGAMPLVQIPENVVKILAAVWL